MSHTFFRFFTCKICNAGAKTNLKTDVLLKIADISVDCDTIVATATEISFFYLNFEIFLLFC